MNQNQPPRPAVSFRAQLLTKKLTKKLLQLNYDAYFKVNYQDKSKNRKQNSQNSQFDILEQIILNLLKVLPPKTNPNKKQIKQRKPKSNQPVQNQNNNKKFKDNEKKEQLNKQVQNGFINKIEKNDSYIIEVMNTFMRIFDDLFQFVKIMNQIGQISNSIANEDRKPFKLLRKFTILQQSITIASKNLLMYDSNNEQFKKKKQSLIAQQLDHFEKLYLNQTNKQRTKHENSQQQLLLNNTFDSRAKIKQELKNPRRSLKIKNQMGFTSAQSQSFTQQTINNLKNTIKQNNQDFIQEIYKYNRKLYDLENQVKFYREELQNKKYLEENIQHLEGQLNKLQQDKYKDQIVIENMARKIRFYEKTKHGSESFLSPVRTSRKNNWNSTQLLQPYDGRKSRDNASMQSIQSRRNISQAEKQVLIQKIQFC